MTQRHYITTAIDYPNAAPHMGHVLEKVLADVVARWHRLQGHEVRLQIGTDEHGTKIAQTAKKEGMTPKELVDRNVPKFEEIYTKLGISYDNFVRTTDQNKHWPTVQALWKKLADAGALEQRSYTGLYCSGCERFVTKKDLVEGNCPDHGIPPQEVTETNWFFRLKGREEQLKALLSSTYRIIPENRAPETLQLLGGGLEDVSFSRPRTTLDWGVPVPGDDAQVMYVWCDALTNYISGIGLLTEQADGKWWDDATVTHVIGKDIARFHALIWPAMLQYAGIRTPDRLLIHGFVTSEGQKMSKSLGNVVDPQEVIAKYPVDVLRFYLSHEIPVGNDGDFNWKHFHEFYVGVMSNKIGNLLNRVVVLLNKDGGSVVLPNHQEMQATVSDLWKKYDAEMEAFDLSAAAADAVSLAAMGNLQMEKDKPWTLTGEGKTTVLSIIAEMLRHTSLMLLPFAPETAQKIARQLAVPYAEQMLEKGFTISAQLKTWGGCFEWKKVGESQILFPRVD